VESDTISNVKYRGGNDGVCSIGATALRLEYISMGCTCIGVHIISTTRKANSHHLNYDRQIEAASEHRLDQVELVPFVIFDTV
jgi:hypothetical protein